MALLVASLLMAALAPVMTKKYKETVEVNGSSSGVRMDYTKTFTKDTKWIVPNGVNYITVTSIGGGGGGGGASYGYKEITSSESNWVVPQGVTKLRVFMTGAGGGGASGGQKFASQIGGIPATTETSDDYLTEGETKIDKFQKSGYGAPALDAKCAASGVTQWTLLANETIKVSPGNIAGSTVKVTACGGGGGGGGGERSSSGGGGGSGGYATKIPIILNANEISIKIPGGGAPGSGAATNNIIVGGYYAGGGGGGGWTEILAGSAGGIGGSQGGYGLDNSKSGDASDGHNALGTPMAYGGQGGYSISGVTPWGSAGDGGRASFDAGAGGGGARRDGQCGSMGAGGGGGGPLTIIAGNTTIFQVGGGGGGGGSTNGGCGTSKWLDLGGGGGGGGGYGGGGGGGGGGGQPNSSAGSGGNGAGCYSANTAVGISDGNKGGSFQLGGYGGGGGGGSNGENGARSANSGGVISGSIFDAKKYCSGGSGQYDTSIDGLPGLPGKQGALRLYYGGAAKSNVYKCQYKDKSNSGSGGGAGQIWIGEIDVTPGQVINFNIGLGGDGGNKDTGVGINGKDGGSTSITINGNTYSVSGGKGGRYESDDTYIANSGGLGGGIKTNNFNNSAKYNNWTNIEYTNGGSAGLQGNTVANGAGGGKGGNTYRKDGTILQGGNPGGAQADGSNAISDNYGAGGGGGGGVINYGSNPGHGGKGANGYIYIEWGSANGGGGASGQVVTERNVLVSAGSTIEIKVGKGGSANDVLTVLNGVNGYFGQKGNDGGESYIIVPPNIEEKHGFAKGGIGGYPAGSSHGTGGNFDDSIVNSTKGQPGNDEFGGNGGNITQALCPLIEAIKGLGGCGGNLTISDSDPVNACANPSSGPVGKNAATIGGGGGGGAVKENAAYKGGNGANGAVIIEWNN